MTQLARQKQPELSEVLKPLSKEELIRIIVQVAEQDSMFKSGLLVKYSQGDYTRQLQLSKQLMNSIVKKYVGRDGFIPYRETYSFASDMVGVMEEIDETTDSIYALEVALMVLAEGVEAFQYADDSNGDIGMLINECFGQIRDLAESLDQQEASRRELFFERVLHMSDSKIFEGWEDFRLELLRICAEFAEDEKLRERLEAAIKRRIDAIAGAQFGKYTAEALLKLLHELIQDYCSADEADKFEEEHLQYTFSE
ncbi:hypothetical protein [Cohnella soli]|uniref:Uncharacterized protein n=1 Tax=Cohnella soli TaxID=425005 RepID=A0ABW0I4F9_9BACL